MSEAGWGKNREVWDETLKLMVYMEEERGSLLWGQGALAEGGGVDGGYGLVRPVGDRESVCCGVGKRVVDCCEGLQDGGG